MKLIIKNKLVSVGGSSTVTDENGNKAYNVKGKVFSVTKKKYVKDLNGKTLFMVRNKFWKFFVHKALIYDGEGHQLARVIRKISLKANFTVEGTEKPLRVEGNFIGLDLDIILGEEKIGHIRRKFVALTDEFHVDVYHDEDAPFLIALVIAIDNICDRASKSGN